VLRPCRHTERIALLALPFVAVLPLQVLSDAHNFSWGDVDDLYFYIPREALAARDFSQVFAYSGD